MNWKWGRQDPPRHPAPVPRPRGWPRRGCGRPVLSRSARRPTRASLNLQLAVPPTAPDEPTAVIDHANLRAPGYLLRRTTMLVHPTLDLRQASLGLHGMVGPSRIWSAFNPRPAALYTRAGRSVARSGGGDGASAKALRGARPGCPSAPLGQHRGRRLPRRPRARSPPLPSPDQQGRADQTHTDCLRVRCLLVSTPRRAPACPGRARSPAIPSGAARGATRVLQTVGRPKPRRNILLVLTPRLSGASGREMALANMLKINEIRVEPGTS